MNTGKPVNIGKGESFLPPSSSHWCFRKARYACSMSPKSPGANILAQTKTQRAVLKKNNQPTEVSKQPKIINTVHRHCLARRHRPPH